LFCLIRNLYEEDLIPKKNKRRKVYPAKPTRMGQIGLWEVGVGRSCKV